MSHSPVLLALGIMFIYPFLLHASLLVINESEETIHNNLATELKTGQLNKGRLYAHSRSSHSTKPLLQVPTTTVRPYNSIQEEIEYLRKAYDNLRKDIDNWMLSPYHRTVILPALIGVATAFLTLSFICCLRLAWNRCVRSCRRDRISHSTREINGDKKRMLSKNADSDEDGF